MFPLILSEFYVLWPESNINYLIDEEFEKTCLVEGVVDCFVGLECEKWLQTKVAEADKMGAEEVLCFEEVVEDWEE